MKNKYFLIILVILPILIAAADYVPEPEGNSGSVQYRDSRGNFKGNSVFLYDESTGLNVTAPDVNRLNKVAITDPGVPASPTNSGVKGTIAYDENFIYICTSDNNWKRAALTTWPLVPGQGYLLLSDGTSRLMLNDGTSGLVVN